MRSLAIAGGWRIVRSRARKVCFLLQSILYVLLAFYSNTVIQKEI